jgi:hypothetical protein
VAVVLDERFEGGAGGATLTSGNSGFPTIVGTPTFDTSWSKEGTRSVLFNASAATQYGQLGSTARATTGIRFYFRLSALPSVATYICTLSTSVGPTVRGQIGIDPAGTIRIRNGVTLTATTTATVSTATVYRAEWNVDNGAGTQALQLFLDDAGTPLSGGNISGTFNGGTFDTLLFGITQSATFSYNADALLVDDTAIFPGPLAGTRPRPIRQQLGVAVSRAGNY